MHHIILLRFGFKSLYRKCKKSAAGLICSIRDRIDSNCIESYTNNVKMTEHHSNISTNKNNFQTESNPTISVVDEHSCGFSNTVPTNSSRDTKHAERIQESIIDLDKMTTSPNEINTGEFPNNIHCYSYPTTPHVPYNLTYPIQNQVYHHIDNPVLSNYGAAIPNCNVNQQNIIDINRQFIPLYNQYPQNAISFPVHTPFQAEPNYIPTSLNYILNQPTTNVLPFDSHRRDFHRQRDFIKDKTKNQNKKPDVMSLRLWEKIDDGKNRTPGFIFTLMSYNVLAQDLADMHPYLYPNHNKDAMKWRSRWPKLFNEIKKFDPDILCLQEVQDSHLGSYYSLLETLGYRGIFKKRTGDQSDGCAIYFKDDIFNMIEHTTVEFRQGNVKLLDRDNVGIVAKFASKLYPAHEFVVATTHLLYNPRRDDVRMAQMQLLLTEVERISYKKPKDEKAYYVPVIITGDFNSPPYSDLYKFVSDGKLHYKNLSPKLLENLTLVTAKLGITDTCQHADLLEERKHKGEISRTEELELIDIHHSDHNKKRDTYNVAEKSSVLKTGHLSHKFALKSVYGHGTVKDMEGTTYQGEWLTVDYIFYSAINAANKEKMKLLARYRLPTGEELGAATIPSQSLGSDHLSLIAKFKLEFS